jgi:hypothetical protein
MGKISQLAAGIAARKIAEPINVKAQQVMSQIEEFVVAIHLKDVPAEIKKLYETHPLWVRQSSDCYVTGPGLAGSYYVEFKKSQPAIKGNRPYIALNAKEAEKVVKLKNQHDDLVKKHRETKQEIEETLLALGSHKKVADNMPEALRFLPDVPSNVGLMVQVEPVREKVKCLISVSEDKKCMENI